jgi:hypothetical protein
MNAKRLLLVTVFALLWASRAHASTIPGHFIVDLNDVFGVDGGGWGANTLFTDTVNTIHSTNGFNPSICVDTDANAPNGDEPDCDSDPSIHINNGGGSVPLPGSFHSDGNGGGSFEFQNDGNSPITDILIITNFKPGNSYTCDSDIFKFCGFEIVNQGGTEKLEALFDNGSIPNVPEPSEYLILLIGCAAIAVAHRVRSTRVSG